MGSDSVEDQQDDCDGSKIVLDTKDKQLLVQGVVMLRGRAQNNAAYPRNTPDRAAVVVAMTLILETSCAYLLRQCYLATARGSSNTVNILLCRYTAGKFISVACLSTKLFFFCSCR